MAEAEEIQQTKPEPEEEEQYYGPSTLAGYSPEKRREALQMLFRTVQDDDLSPEAHAKPMGSSDF